MGLESLVELGGEKESGRLGLQLGQWSRYSMGLCVFPSYSRGRREGLWEVRTGKGFESNS